MADIDVAPVRISVDTLRGAYQRLYGKTPCVLNADFWAFAHAMHVRLAFRKKAIDQAGVGGLLDANEPALDHYMAILQREFGNEKQLGETE